MLVSKSDCYLDLILIQYLTNSTNLQIVRRQCRVAKQSCGAFFQLDPKPGSSCDSDSGRSDQWAEKEPGKEFQQKSELADTAAIHEMEWRRKKQGKKESE